MLTKMLRDFYNFVFTETCAGCQKILVKKEKLLCLLCKHKLPLTNFHKHNENTLKNIFSGRIPVNYATALFYFHKKGITQHILHNLKYKNTPKLSNYFGLWYAEELLQTQWIKEIDIIIPVPLHAKRLRERGYNQTEGFAKELSKKLEIPCALNVLQKTSAARTQVFKSKIARSKIDLHYFNLKNPQKIEGKHVLLVDDVITTGATMQTCVQTLLQASSVKVSLASMAFTA